MADALQGFPATKTYKEIKKVTASERTRISCHAALDRTACAPFSKERRMKIAKATKFDRKSGAAEGSAVLRTLPGNVFDASIYVAHYTSS